MNKGLGEGSDQLCWVVLSATNGGEDRDLSVGTTRELFGSSGGEIQPTKLGLGGGLDNMLTPLAGKGNHQTENQGPEGP